METINICLRVVKYGQFKGSLDIVILDYWDDRYNSKLESFGNVGSIGTGYCHSIGDYNYFRDYTKQANVSQYADILESFREIYKGYNIVIKSRLTRKLAKSHLTLINA